MDGVQTQCQRRWYKTAEEGNIPSTTVCMYNPLYIKVKPKALFWAFASDEM